MNNPKGQIHGEEVLKSVRKNRVKKKEKLAKAILIQNLNQHSKPARVEHGEKI